MLKGMTIAVAIAILVVGAAWVVVVAGSTDVKQPVRTEIRYVPQPVPVVESGEIVQVGQLKAENSNLERQLAASRNELTICQQQKIAYDSYKRDTYDRSDSYFYDDNNNDDEWDLLVRVRDDDTGDPIEDARVRVENGDDDSEYTDDDGEAEFNNLEDDCYDIEVSADGYEDEEDDICLDDDERITIRLIPE
jgi:hypothetical protein